MVKRYAHAFLLTAEKTQTVVIKVAADKKDFTCNISRGVVTCKHLITGESHTYGVRGEKVRLATSICAKIDALEIYVTWQGEAKISLDGGEPIWLSAQEIAENQRLEQIVNRAYRAKFMRGERLRSRYLAALKLVPSLELLTKVVVVRDPADFLTVWQERSLYQQIARLFKGFNLVFLYAGAVPAVAEIVKDTVTTEQVKKCHNDCLWVYFIDRTTIDADALYYLLKLAQAGHYVPMEPTPPGLEISRTWPYVKTLTVANTLPQKMTRDLVVPLVFNRMSVVSATGSVLKVVNLTSGHESN